MKSNYEKYINEVWEMKQKSYNDYKVSGFLNYRDYLKNELKNYNLKYRNKKILSAK